MTDMTLDQTKNCFAEWRSRRQPREPIPEDMCRVACSQIPAIGITRVARELRIEESQGCDLQFVILIQFSRRISSGL
jgi:hypothetical protein